MVMQLGDAVLAGSFDGREVAAVAVQPIRAETQPFGHRTCPVAHEHCVSLITHDPSPHFKGTSSGHGHLVTFSTQSPFQHCTLAHTEGHFRASLTHTGYPVVSVTLHLTGAVDGQSQLLTFLAHLLFQHLTGASPVQTISHSEVLLMQYPEGQRFS